MKGVIPVIAMSTVEVLCLYRNILRHAVRFPSIKRVKIVNEIKLGFRANAHLTEGLELSKQLDVAQRGLQQLAMYTSLPKNSTKWEVSMEKTPMPSSKPSPAVAVVAAKHQ